MYMLQCNKLKRKKGGFLGPLITAHTTQMDDTDRVIMNAK